MKYEFTKKRRPKSAQELTDAQRKQLALAWEYYAGEALEPEKLVAENPEWFELWSVEHDGAPAFEYWHLPPDSGTLFYAGEDVPTGIRVIQFGWDVGEDVPARSGIDLASLGHELDDAWRARRDA